MLQILLKNFPVFDKLISAIIITRKRRMGSSLWDMKFKFTFASTELIRGVIREPLFALIFGLEILWLYKSYKF